jgi:NitT/TauT family transport system substrate-binding protein
MGDVDPARLTKHIQIVTEGFQLPRTLASAAVFDSSFLPPLAERRLE